MNKIQSVAYIAQCLACSRSSLHDDWGFDYFDFPLPHSLSKIIRFKNPDVWLAQVLAPRPP